MTALLLLHPGAVRTEETRPSGIVEHQEVRRVQIDVSVIDPHHDDRASVPGLTRDVFELRVDHEPLPPDLAARVEFDEICPSHRIVNGLPRDNGLADERPSLIAFVDLNFLDIRARFRTADALKELAEIAAKRPLRVKVIAFARHLIPLTSEFTSDPAVIARAARALTSITANGPTIGGPRSAPALKPNERIPSTPMAELTDSGAATDPDQVRPAFELMPADLLKEISGAKRFAPHTDPMIEYMARDVDARPSLTALEAVLLSHAGLRGRKAVIVFSSAWFDLPDELWLQSLAGPRQAAQGGYTIWTVDAYGFSGNPGSHSSRLMGWLASSTGGEAIRSGGRLSIAFDRALSTLSCYYLFSIPLPRPSEGERSHDVDVFLDTHAHPEMWGYRVRTSNSVTLLDPVLERQRRRLAGLMEPDAHRLPEVRLSASYPVGSERPVTMVEIGTVLSDLTFSPGPRGVEARFAIEGIVTDETGRTICALGSSEERRIVSELAPTRFPPSMLVVRNACTLRGAGVYDLRAVVEDLATGDIGGASARLDFASLDVARARVSALVIGRGSGRDFIVEASAPKTVEVLRDREYRAFVPLRAGEVAVTEDRVALRFVTCGEGDPAVMLYGLPVAPGPPTLAPVQPSLVRRAEQRGPGSTCRELEASLAPGKLVPGRYRFWVLDPPADRTAPGNEGWNRLGQVDFEVVAPVAGAKPVPGQHT